MTLTEKIANIIIDVSNGETYENTDGRLIACEIDIFKMSNKIYDFIEENNIYKLECLDNHGQIECNGYFISYNLALKEKEYLDNLKENKKYGIIQNIVKIQIMCG